MMAKSFSFSIAREEECKFIDEWKVLVYSSKLDTFGTLKLKLFSIPKCDKVVPEPTIYNLYPQPNLQFGIPNVYIKSITISGHHALIDTIDGYQLWNLSLEMAGQIPLPDCAPYMNMYRNWLLDANKTSELLIAFFTGSGPSAEANFALVFTGFDSPKFLHRLLLPQHEHFDAHFGARLIVTKGVARTALLISCPSNQVFICDLQNEAEFIHYNPEVTNLTNHVSPHVTLSAPYHPLPSFDSHVFSIHSIPKWKIFKISFDGKKFLVSQMEVHPPNCGEIPDNIAGKCFWFKVCYGGLVGVSDTRVLWSWCFSARHHYRYLIEQDFLM